MIIKNLMYALTLAIFALFISSCGEDETIIEEPKTLPASIAMNESALYPEGIVYSDSEEKFYVGSYYKGKIMAVDTDGNMETFISDQSLVSVVGLAIDETNNWLIACNSDSGLGARSDSTTTGVLAEVIVYDLSTGEKIRTTDLSTLFLGGHFINDVTSDNNGNLYATDSFVPIVYKIDANGNASILINDPAFEVPPGAFGLNGLVYHPDNYLIVGKAFGGVLYKIPLDNPSNFSEIAVDGPVNSLDGLLLTDDNTLVLVSNNFTGAPFKETVYQIKTNDGWASGSINSSFEDLLGTYPTTATAIGETVYVSFGFFTVLVSGANPVENFVLQKVLF